MGKNEEQRLDGTRMDPWLVQMILEILNEGPEPGRLPVDVRERFEVCRPKDRRIGRVFVASTVEDMERGGNELWKE